MKTRLYLRFSILMMIAIVAIVSFSCQKDDEDEEDNENTRNNSFTYQGHEYAISKGCYYLTSVGSVYDYSLKLASSSISFIYNDTLGYVQQSGTGNYVYIDLYTSNSDITGSFVCDDSGGSEDTPHFEDGIIIMNGNFDNGWPDEIGILDGGTLQINKNGNIYEIIFNWTSNDGKPITGYYKGELVFYN